METIKNCIESGRYFDTRHVQEHRRERKITGPEVLFVLKKLDTKAVLIAKLYSDLESIPSDRPKSLDLDVGNLAD